MSDSSESRGAVRVLFVCLGNICRSPTSEGVFRKLLETQQLDFDIEVDSAGTAGYHVGDPPDRRATAAAARRDIDISALRARRTQVYDMETFDYIIAMDRSNYHDLIDLCPHHARGKIRLFMDFADEWDFDEVPDPYFGGDSGFERVLDMIESAAGGLLEEIKGIYGARS